jgi:hypothetical protein
MKSKRVLFLLIIILSIVPIVSIFLTPLLPHTSDGGVHLPRIGAFYKALRDGNIPVRWAGDINYGYGLPLFNFIYHTPYVIASFFVMLGLGLVVSFKLVLLISFIFSGIFMYAFAREFFQDGAKAFMVTILYQFSPFRLVEILVRGSIGEIYVYTFFPLVLFGITKLNKKRTTTDFILTAVAAGLLILSHNSLSAVFFVLCVLYIFFIVPKNRIITPLLTMVTGMSLSAYYWIPAIMEHKFTYGDLFMKDLYKTNFPPLINFFIPNIFNTAALRVSEVAVSFGLVHILAIGCALILLFKNKLKHKPTKKLFLLCAFATVGAIFFMQPVSLPFWERITLLRQFQFPWRLLSVICFTSSIFGVSFFSFQIFRKKQIQILLVFVAVVSTVYFWKPTQGYDRVNESDFWSYPLNTTYFGETDVIWSAGEATSYPLSQIQMIEGKGTVLNILKKTTLHTFDVTAKTPLRLVDNTTYFPGWRVYDGKNKLPIQFQDMNWRGLITFRLTSGVHHIRVSFEESQLRFVADIISLLAVISLFGFAMVRFIKVTHEQ